MNHIGENLRSRQFGKVLAGLTQSNALKGHLANAKSLVNEIIESNIAGNNIASTFAITKAASVRRVEPIDHFGLDECDFIVMCAHKSLRECAAAGVVSIAHNSATGLECDLADRTKWTTGFRTDIDFEDGARHDAIP